MTEYQGYYVCNGVYSAILEVHKYRRDTFMATVWYGNAHV